MYITYKAAPKTRQITIDEILAGIIESEKLKYREDVTSTVTVCRDELTPRLRAMTDINRMIRELETFNKKYEQLESEPDMSVHYTHYEIPKKTGGMRPIDAPDKILSDALNELQTLLKSFMLADYHTAAHAYVPHRSTLTAVKKHQEGHVRTKTNPTTGEKEQVIYENNWSVKFDFHGFFPSSNPEFVMGMLSVIYPFALIMQDPFGGHEALSDALKIAFLRNGLPQGSPLSPWLTNVMMIPFDHLLSRKIRHGFRMKDGITRDFTYTRYADDITISCYLSFDYMEMQDVIKNILAYIHAPFTLNEEKTHYGNRHSSKNWVLGLMWNQDNEITVGWRNIKTFKIMLSNYIRCKKENAPWTIEDVQELNGLISYYQMVEKDKIEALISKANNKYHVDAMAMIKDDLRPKDAA